MGSKMPSIKDALNTKCGQANKRIYDSQMIHRYQVQAEFEDKNCTPRNRVRYTYVLMWLLVFVVPPMQMHC